jgi:uncharacterized membrane protein
MNTLLAACQKGGLIVLVLAMCVTLIAGLIARPWLIGVVVGGALWVVVVEFVIDERIMRGAK